MMMTHDTPPRSSYPISSSRSNGPSIGLGNFPSSLNLGKNIKIDRLIYSTIHWNMRLYSFTAPRGATITRAHIHTCPITTNTLTTTHIHDNTTDLCTSSSRLTSTNTSQESEFRDHTAITTKSFFGIQHTLEGDIFRSPIKYLASVHTRLKNMKHHKYSIVSVQTLLQSLVIFVCGYNPLCNKIPYDKCLTLDRALHSKYIRDTRHTVIQPAHDTFLSRDHHCLHIPSLLPT